MSRSRGTSLPRKLQEKRQNEEFATIEKLKPDLEIVLKKNEKTNNKNLEDNFKRVQLEIEELKNNFIRVQLEFEELKNNFIRMQLELTQENVELRNNIKSLSSKYEEIKNNYEVLKKKAIIIEDFEGKKKSFENAGSKTMTRNSQLKTFPYLNTSNKSIVNDVKEILPSKTLLFIFNKMDLSSLVGIFSKHRIIYQAMSIEEMREKLNENTGKEFEKYFASFDKVLLFLKINKAIVLENWSPFFEKLNEWTSKINRLNYDFVLFNR